MSAMSRLRDQMELYWRRPDPLSPEVQGKFCYVLRERENWDLVTLAQQLVEIGAGCVIVVLERMHPLGSPPPAHRTGFKGLRGVIVVDAHRMSYRTAVARAVARAPTSIEAIVSIGNTTNNGTEAFRAQVRDVVERMFRTF